MPVMNDIVIENSKLKVTLTAEQYEDVQSGCQENKFNLRVSGDERTEDLETVVKGRIIGIASNALNVQDRYEYLQMNVGTFEDTKARAAAVLAEPLIKRSGNEERALSFANEQLSALTQSEFEKIKAMVDQGLPSDRYTAGSPSKVILWTCVEAALAKAYDELDKAKVSLEKNDRGWVIDRV
jgi:hypothetical protein